MADGTTVSTVSTVVRICAGHIEPHRLVVDDPGTGQDTIVVGGGKPSKLPQPARDRQNLVDAGFLIERGAYVARATA